ncbi:MAG: sulfur carrier protein ThiS [Deltaproteobacteria bacterium]|jgi:sulfur carrier protein|nr:sulfur carrier protein ThiS [Deltaproteobacteria bacterium]
MELLINGEPRTMPAGLTVATLLLELGIRGERVAIELNGEVIRKEQRAEKALAPADRIEIVSFVGGG